MNEWMDEWIKGVSVLEDKVGRRLKSCEDRVGRMVRIIFRGKI